jgi:serine/threonine-protein kinase
MSTRALTPDYASPELLRGDPVDARSDVYSLGVLLYELLTGVRPYRLQRAASIGMLEEAITTVDVKKPSAQCDPEAIAARATTPEKFTRLLRGDLDAIALKALAKDPAKRYPSVTALAEDLRRYLDGRLIEALPARFSDRLLKFVRRNKTVVGNTVIAASAIRAAVAFFWVWLYCAPAPRAAVARDCRPKSRASRISRGRSRRPPYRATADSWRFSRIAKDTWTRG